MKTINNTPIACKVCGGIAYGQEQVVNCGSQRILECTWVCSRCSGVSRRESEVVETEKVEETPAE